MRALRIAAVALVAAIALPAPVAQAKPTRAQAKAALVKVQQLREGHGVHTGHELTPALRDLFRSLPALSGDDRTAAESILARPDDEQKDPDDTHKWTPRVEAGGSPRCGAHFCVHWTMLGADASNASYAQSMLDIFENEVYPCENGTAAASCAGSPGLGWREAASDAPLGGDARVDVYIEDLFTNEHVFGYVALDPGQSVDPAVPHYAYMVMDKDYTRYSSDGSAASGLAAERVTAAHEYNHILQNAYDYLEDRWMFEATAVYMEDKVYPANNDYLNYVTAWVANPKQPLTAFPSSNLKAYGSAVWNHWLDHRFGSAVVRGAWEQSVGAANFAPGAYSAAISAAGGADFSDEFNRFAAAVAEWQAPDAGFPDRYPDVARDAVLATGTQTVPFSLPHTTFAFFDVPIPPTNPPTIRLTGRLPAGTAGAIALVARVGQDPAAGPVTTSLTPMPTGGIAAASLDNPAQYGHITAVVVNSDPSRGGFDPALDDYVFTKDAGDVVVSMAEPGPPIPVTGPAGLITDHGAFVNATVDPHLIDTTWSIEYGRTPGYGSSTVPAALPATTVGAASVVVPLRHLKAHATYHYRVVASNSAGIAAGADMSFKTARDITKPKVSIKVKRQRIATVRTRGLVYLARCSERCRGRAELRLSRRSARRAGLPELLGKTRVELGAHPKLRKFRVRLNRRARAGLATRRRPLQAVLVFRVADESRNRRIVRAQARLAP